MADIPHADDETERNQNKENKSCEELFCTGPRDVRFEEREFRKSSGRRTPSSESRPRACAGLICGRIAAFSRLLSQPRWGTSTAASVEEVGSAVKSVKRGQSSSVRSFASEQHLSQLPYRIPVVLPASRARRRRTGPLPACPARGWYIGRDT